jgi:Protein of unknown function (DUF1186)/SEC-C motif
MQILDQLGSGEGMPIEAIRAATAERTMVAPLLIDAIERCDPEGEIQENGLFIAFHLLGQWREKSAYRKLARFLRWPEVEAILGDATTETCHKVMANVFDGDPAPIYEIIHDADADEFVRGRMFGTLVILVLQGQLDRQEVASFLRSAFTDLQPQDQSVIWSGWQGAIAMLALTELESVAKEAFERGFIDELDLSFENFEEDLRRASTGRLEERQRKEYEPFGDVIEELSHWSGFRPEKARDEEDGWLPPLATPAHNPFRDVGRNDPCPCGSGKKFKKCCLGKPEAELQMIATPDDRFLANWRNRDAGTGVELYDPLVGPNPEVWLAIDEQDRIDLIEHYHRRRGFKGERARAHAIFHAIVENQIAEGDRLPVRRTLLRLMAEGLDRHDAIHAIGAVLAGHINELLREEDAEALSRSGDDSNAAYYSALEKLTAAGWLNSG